MPYFISKPYFITKEGCLMENCPNCNNHVCVNPSITQTLNFLDLITESNLFELETNEEFLLMEFILSEDFINRHKKPRRIPSKIPRKLPKSISNNLFERLTEDNFQEYCGVISVTCKNTPLVFEYAEAGVDLEYLDN